MPLWLGVTTLPLSPAQRIGSKRSPYDDLLSRVGLYICMVYLKDPYERRFTPESREPLDCVNTEGRLKS